MPNHCLPASLALSHQDVAFADELLGLVHAVRKAELRAGRTCSTVQVVDLGE